MYGLVCSMMRGSHEPAPSLGECHRETCYVQDPSSPFLLRNKESSISKFLIEYCTCHSLFTEHVHATAFETQNTDY